MCGLFSSCYTILTLSTRSQHRSHRFQGLVPQDQPWLQGLVQVVTCTSNQLGISQEFLQPPPWVWYLSRRAHRTQLTGKHYHLLLIKDKTQKQPGASLAVQWFRFCASHAGCMRSIPGAGTEIPHASWQGRKNKQTNKKKPPETKFRKPNGRDS